MPKVCWKCGYIVHGDTCSNCIKRETSGMSRTGLALWTMGIVGLFFTLFIGIGTGSSGGMIFIWTIGSIISIILMVIGSRKKKRK